MRHHSTPVLVVCATALALPAVAACGGTDPPSASSAGDSSDAGAVLYHSTDGDIMAMDPDAGTASVLIDGPAIDRFPVASPSGTAMTFERTGRDGPHALWVAGVDGGSPRELVPSLGGVVWVEWARSSDAVVTVTSGGRVTLHPLDGSEPSVVEPDEPVLKASVLPDGRMLLVTRDEARGAAFVLTEADGSDPTVLPTAPGATDEYSLAPDGSRVAYLTWGDDPSTVGRIHLIDLTTQRDTSLTPYLDGLEWVEPVFSADGVWVKADRYDGTAAPHQVVLLATDGSGTRVALGSPSDDLAATAAVFAPDSGSVFVIDQETGVTHRFDTRTGSGSVVDWPGLGMVTSWVP